MVTLESFDEIGLEAHNDLEDDLFGLSLPLHQTVLGVTGGGLYDELEVAVSVWVWRVNMPGGVGGDGVDEEAWKGSVGMERGAFSFTGDAGHARRAGGRQAVGDVTHGVGVGRFEFLQRSWV